MSDGSIVVPIDMVWNAGLSISTFWDQKMFEEHYKCHTVYAGEHKVYLRFDNAADASMFLLRWC